MSDTTSQPPPRMPDWDAIPGALRKELNISREEFEAIADRMREREERAPQAGHLASDFELQRLDGEGKLTGERLKLSALRGRPVALVFGSYT